jgi:DNA-binding LacI/PurR family transcriptional regulator
MATLQPLPRSAEGIERLVHRMRGRKLPPERDLAKQFGISRGRVRAVLDMLEAKGLVVRHQGSGTYALEDGSAAVSTVALLVDARLKLAEDPFFSGVIERVQQVCQTEGLRCTLERVTEGEKPLIVEDGIIAVGLATREVLERLGRNDGPAVGLFVRARSRVGSRVTVLDLDDEGAGRLAMEHVIAAGCSSVVFLGPANVSSAQRRLRGAMQAAEDAGRRLTAIESPLNYAAGLIEAAKLTLPNSSARVGIIAGSDWLALGLHTGLLNRGVKARERVAIVSFDGLPITADPSLGIRSLVAPIDAMATDAVAELRRLAAARVACGREILYALA